MNALYPRLKNQWIAAGCPLAMKRQMPEAFKRDGFLLLDVFDRSRKVGDPLPEALERLRADLKVHIEPDTPIIPVHVTLHEQVFEPLRRWGYTRAWHGPIAFPASGQQGRFHAGFVEALAALRSELQLPLHVQADSSGGCATPAGSAPESPDGPEGRCLSIPSLEGRPPNG